MDHSYMVFDEDPHGNKDMPFYFLRKLYAEFILGKHVNYFDILGFQGVSHGMPQDREGARIDTHEALFDLENTLLQHGTSVQGNVDQGVGTSKAGPSTDHTRDVEHSERHVTPHPYTLCGGICYGLASDF